MEHEYERRVSLQVWQATFQQCIANIFKTPFSRFKWTHQMCAYVPRAPVSKSGPSDLCNNITSVISSQEIKHTGAYTNNMRWYSQQLVAMKNGKHLSECMHMCTSARLWLCELVTVWKMLLADSNKLQCVCVRTTQDCVCDLDGATRLSRPLRSD